MYLRRMLGKVRTWVTAMSKTLSTNGAGWANYAVRVLVPSSELAYGGIKVKITFSAASGENLKIDNVSIVEQNSGANGTTTPTELLFSGASGCDVPAGSTKVTDELTYTIDKTKSYLITYDVSSDASKDGDIRLASATGYTTYYSSGANWYNQQNVSPGTTESNVLRVISKIEVYT